MPSDRDEPARGTVVGGGPAGLMAAQVLAENGMAVTVYEHMASVGRKFQLAGRGGLNLTHTDDLESFLDRYGPGRPHLERAINQFTPADLRAWSERLGEPTFVGSSGRVFPESFRATPLLRSWLRHLAGLGVQFELRHRWTGWSETPTDEPSANTASRPSLFARTGSTEEYLVAADVTVFALGGASWPRVGSDGGWAEPFVAAGVRLRPLRPANCGVRVAWTKHVTDRFAGTPLKNATVTVGDRPVPGDPIITSSGLEGGPIYAHSAAIRDYVDRHGRCTLVFDLAPDLAEDRLADRLTGRRRPKDSTSTWLKRSGVDPAEIALLREATGNNLPSDTVELAALIKAVPITVDAMMPIDRAISTAGGISFEAIDERFMLRAVPGNFVAGEMLDWEAPTGGYLLQASFSTAVAAANGAIAWVRGQGSGTPSDASTMS